MSKTTLEQVTQLADELSLEEKLSLIDHLKKQLQEKQAGSDSAVSGKPQSLYGIWRGKVADDFDIDAALYEIRYEWEKECGSDLIKKKRS